jgi:phosphoenolpyruvate carboxylase
VVSDAYESARLRAVADGLAGACRRLIVRVANPFVEDEEQAIALQEIARQARAALAAYDALKASDSPAPPRP